MREIVVSRVRFISLFRVRTWHLFLGCLNRRQAINWMRPCIEILHSCFLNAHAFFFYFFLGRRNDKTIINSHTHISGGTGVWTLIMTFGRTISAFCQLSWDLWTLFFFLIHPFFISTKIFIFVALSTTRKWPFSFRNFSFTPFWILILCV